MNCKPDDVAVLVRNTRNDTCFGANIGAFVEVDSVIGIHSRQGAVWMLKRPIQCLGCGHPLGAMLDADLQP
ncbi:hypothetical protein, partial [Brucella melitensis]|uniref:hypothetical protein n=1 Tax=Brucella melitensis TaxID=29459 RepID=UPI003B66B38A